MLSRICPAKRFWNARYRSSLLVSPRLLQRRPRLLPAVARVSVVAKVGGGGTQAVAAAVDVAGVAVLAVAVVA